ncbi:MAG: hypothetical protein A2X86_10190 [Bdellovibrionales bacterium GWA2_49_15]|nr:MAG: hypothetical protein A2X86_10190 [Bdellovibrionales bacterium GWA2_49_15]HAZ13754.1 hypothetical protein [Bdellovibrionales bacterium]
MLVFIILILVLAPFEAFSLIRMEDAVVPELAVSGRAMAMGNAFICKVDDATSILYNPAGLGTVRNTHLHMSNFYLEANKGWLNVGTGGKASEGFSNFAKSLDLEGIRTLVKDHPGEMVNSRFSIMPNFTTRHFSIGYLYSNQVRATYGKEEGALYEYAERLDHGPYVGMNMSFWGGVLKLGATGIFLTRKELIDEQPIDQEVILSSDQYNQGSAFMLDTGMKFTIPMEMLPTFAVVMHNTMGKNFAAKQGSPDNPTKIARSISTGFSLTPQIGPTARIHFEFNFKDVSHQYQGVSGQRRSTFGIEIDMWRAIFVRFGFGDGYGSAGLGLKSQRLELDLTTYAVDSTSSEFRGVEDRRFVFAFSSGF